MEDLAKLGLVIETGDVSAALRELEALRKKLAENDKQGQQHNKTFKETNQVLSGLSRVAGAVTAALSIGQIVSYANTWSDLNGRLVNVTKSQEAADAALKAIAQTARNTYSSLEQTAEAFLNNAQTLTELGYSTERQLVLSDALNNGLVISGVSGEKAASVMGALSRALANGTLRGEEFNTIVQSGGRITQALADGLGVSTLELRGLAEKGLLTTGKVFDAITGQAEKLGKEAGDMAVTIRDGFTTVNSALLQTVGRFNDVTGAGEFLGESLVGIADALNEIDPEAVLGKLIFYTDEAVLVGGALATLYVARLAPSVLAAGGAFLTKTSAVLANARAMGTATVAANSLRGAMAFLGGPAGVVFIAATALAAYAINANTAASNTDLLAQELDGLSKLQAQSNLYKVKDAIKDVENQLANTAKVVAANADAFQMNVTLGADVEATRRAYDEEIARQELLQAELDKLKQREIELGTVIDGTRDKTSKKTTAVGELASVVNIASKAYTTLNEDLQDEIIKLQLSADQYEIHNALVKLGAEAKDDERRQIVGMITALQGLRKEREAEKAAAATKKEFTATTLEIAASNNPAEQARQELEERLQVIRQYAALEAADKAAARQAELDAYTIFNERITEIQESQKGSNFVTTITDSLASLKDQATGTLAQMAIGLGDNDEMAKRLAQTILTQLVGAVINYGVEQSIAYATGATAAASAEAAKTSAVLAAVGVQTAAATTATGVITSAQVASGASIAMAMAPAAAATSIATAGAAPAAATPIALGTIGTIIAAIVGGFALAKVVGGRAVGGQVLAGNTYQINERGVELFTPRSAGTITPFSQLMQEARSGTVSETNNNSKVELNLIVQAQDTNGLEEWAVNNRDLFYNMVVQALNERGQTF